MAQGIRTTLRRALATGLALTFVTLPLPQGALASATLPEAPRATVDTTMPAVTGQTINVASGGNLQSAIDNAQLGDEIVLAAGATFSGVTLRTKSGSGWIIIRSSRSSELPAGTRVSPADAPKMARILGGDGSASAVTTENGAHHYRFIGIEFTVSPGVFNTGLVRLGTSSETSLSQLPHHLIVDRCYIHGDPNTGGRRGVNLNGSYAAVIDSYIAGWKAVAQDSQAIGGWTGSGPFKVENNYLEGAAENLMFGGGDPPIDNLVPSDIEILRNHFFKPTTWRSQSWQVKNLLELKNARRVRIDGNLFENNWYAAQNGTAILFSVRNQDGTAPWTAVQDISFTNNIVRHVAAGLKITGYDDTGRTVEQTNRILVKNNVFDDVNSNTWGGDGRMFFLLFGATNVTIDHNTGFPNGSFIMSDNSRSFTNHVFTNNIATRGIYGVKGDSNGEGLPTLTNLFPGYVFSRNAVIGANSSIYPPDNFFPSSTSAVGFVDYANTNYRLGSGSPYNNAGTDGTDIGADLDKIAAAMAGSGDGGGGTGGGGATTSPTVSFSNPASDATVSGTVTVSTSATGGSGGYTYKVNVGTTNIYTGTNGTFSWDTKTVADGTKTLTATATDSAGSSGSASRSVTVSNTTSGTTMTASFTSPAAGATVSGTVPVKMAASGVTGSTTFTLKLGTTTLFKTTMKGTTTWYNWDTKTVANGSKTLTLIATNSGKSATASRTVTVSNSTSTSTSGDTTPPTVTITSPPSGVWTGNSLDFTAAATDNVGLARIEFWGNGSVFGTIPCSTTSCSGLITWITGPLPPAAYQVTAVAQDKAGNRTLSGSITIYKDGTSPLIASGAK